MTTSPIAANTVLTVAFETLLYLHFKCAQRDSTIIVLMSLSVLLSFVLLPICDSTIWELKVYNKALHVTISLI